MNIKINIKSLCLVVTLCYIQLILVTGFPQQGKWTLKLNDSDLANSYNGIAKNLYKDTKIYIRVNCHNTGGDIQNNKIKIGWILRETQCWNDFAFIEAQQNTLFENYYAKPWLQLPDNPANTSVNYLRVGEQDVKCEDSITLVPNFDDHLTVDDSNEASKDTGAKKDVERETTLEDTESSASSKNSEAEVSVTNSGPNTKSPQYTLKHDGDYLFVIHIGGSSFQAEVELEMVGPSGYLSIVDWPLLPFYGVMCGIYVCMGIGWLVVSAMHWRDLLRIQFWIGGVIFLGMLEKAMFYGEFQNINSTGKSTKGLILIAEIVSCAKRTLARMLVIIVSLGFGIVKPRLGPTLHRVVGIGGLYFALASTEAYLRVMKPKNDVSTGTLLAGIPLAVIDR